MTANSSDQPLSDTSVVDRLGEDLRSCGYDADGVPELLGDSVHRALGRGEFAPALRATRDSSPLATLTRLFLLGASADERAVSAALPRTGIADALRQGVLERDGGSFRAALDIRPHSADAAEFLLVSDLDSDTRPGPVRTDHVLGVGSASITLAKAVIRHPVDRALDVGTGSGIQALHLAGHANSVVATDVNPRALALAAATARLNDQRWDLRVGSLFEPVDGEDFDLIVSNPPFVISDGEMRYSYRDSGMAGDGICQRIVENIGAHLRPGGTAQLLANWIVRDNADWRDRVGSWVEASGLDAWVVQREMADPAEYVGLWLADAGEDGKAAGSDRSAATRLAGQWLEYLASERVQGIGMGLITLRRSGYRDSGYRDSSYWDSGHGGSGSGNPLVTLDEITGPGEDVTGDEADGFLRRRAWVERTSDVALLGSRLAVSAQVMLEQSSLAGADGWIPVLRMARRLGGPGATLQLDEWGQALLGGCTGAVPLELLIDLLAAAHGLRTDALIDAVLPSVRVAITRGLLEPVIG